jgi:hypothetical protein
MSTRQIIWTVLPNGATHVGGKTYLKLSLFISPRLRSAHDTLLKDFDFNHWPVTLGKAKFDLRFISGTRSHDVRAVHDPSSPRAEDTIWRYLFHDDTFVRGYEFDDLSNRFIVTHPAADIRGFVRSTYQNLVSGSPNELPDRGNLEEGFSAIIDQSPSSVELGKQLLAQRHSAYAEVHHTFPPPNGPAQALTQVRMFHYRPPDYRGVSRWPTKPQHLDFHQMVSSLSKFPQLMRRLGLVVDLIVPLDAGIPGDTVGDTVEVLPPFGSADDVTPKTRYQLKGNQFAAASRGADIQHGMLNLADGKRFQLLDVDVDGAALKIYGFLSAVSGSSRDIRPGTPETFGLPALRSGGFALVHTGRALSLNDALTQMAQNNQMVESNQGNSVELYAEDLVRGYRVDVWDTRSKVWHSLCERAPAPDPKKPGQTYLGAYFFPNAPAAKRYLNIPDEEGFVSMGVAHDSADMDTAGKTSDLYLHESLWRWLGWSLVAQRPGKGVGRDDQPSISDNSPGEGVGLVTHFGAKPHSLPRLRFGVGYRVRARAVDLAGNSLPLSSGEDQFATPSKGRSPQPYGRFEPVVAPAVVLRNDVSGSPGESVARLVIRSDFDKKPDAEVRFLAAKGFHGFVVEPERHVAPPRTSELMAETHGLFDTPSGVNVNAYTLIANRDGTFADGNVENTDHLKLPYLPDPLARGASLFGLPGVGGAWLQPFTGAWPDTNPFRIRLVELEKGQGQAPHWDAAHRLLTVKIAKGEMTTFRLSSYINLRDLDLMGMWVWLKEMSLPATKVTELKKLATEGLLWAVTPWRDITVVHAVQRPLRAPEFKSLAAYRDTIGETYATLVADPMLVDGKSTVKLDILADWQEPRDDPLIDPSPQGSLPKIIHGHAHVLEAPVEPSDKSVLFGIRQSRLHQLGDTKYRRITYTAAATTRFREYFPRAGVDSGKLDITRPGPASTIDVPSTARPDAPKILYVIPVFEWTGRRTGNTTKSERRGGWLRVYMDRPWFSSGAGELLGVVVVGGSPAQVAQRRRRKIGGRWVGYRVRRQETSPVTPILKPYVTQWGMDPIWRAAPLGTPPTTGRFTAAVNSRAGLTLDELGFGVAAQHPVAVAGHSVLYDPARSLWYADIAIDAGKSYFPFVRLALARYQPHSISNPDTVHLSRVVLADFVQLAPNRTATVQTNIDHKNKRRVRVSVVGPVAVLGEFGVANVIELSVEQRTPDIPGDEGWMQIANSTQFMHPVSIAADTLWSLTFDLPHPVGTVPFRLVLKEYEELPVSLDLQQTANRLVYAGAIEI